MRVKAVKNIRGEIRVPSDKSISHRAVIVSSLADGESIIKNWLISDDTLATLQSLMSLGVEVKRRGSELTVKGKNFLLEEPGNVLDAKNSGTTARLMLGVLSTQEFFSVITGDESLRGRPMLRVVEPLRQMGALIDGRHYGDKLPICVRGGNLKGISFFNKKASAQIKSSLLLAGLRAEGIVEVIEPYLSRDHTERMLRLFGAELLQMEGTRGHIVKLTGGQKLHSAEVYCPADPSSAAFFAALALLTEGSELVLRDVLINPTRDGFYRKLIQMGADVSFEDVREVSFEPVANVLIRGGRKLKAVEVKEDEVPSLIDEIPVLAVVMSLADGVSRVRGARDLRVKESDRIKAITQNLRAMGVKVEEYEDGFDIEGTDSLKGAFVKTYNDHRIAMAFSIAGLLAQGETIIDNPRCVSVSYPSFYKDLKRLIHQT